MDISEEDIVEIATPEPSPVRVLQAESMDMEEIDGTIDEDEDSIAVLATHRKPKRQRKRRKKEICTGTPVEPFSLLMADPIEVAKRESAMNVIDGYIEKDFPAALHDMTVKAQKESVQDAKQPDPPALFRPPSKVVVPQNQKLFLKNLMLTCPNQIGTVLNTILSSLPVDIPKASHIRTTDETMKSLDLALKDWIIKNLIHPHGNWPACSRPLFNATGHQPRSLSTGWTSDLCAILLCPRVKTPFPLRAFYPLESDAEAYARNNNFPDDEPPLCALCQLCDMDDSFGEIQEHQNISLPEYCLQLWYVEVDVVNGFDSILCNLPSDRPYNGLMFPVPRFLPAGFEDGEPLSDPAYGPVPLPTLRMLYDDIAQLMQRTRVFK